MYSTILATMIPVLVAIALGWIWVRAGRVLDATSLARVVSDIGTPCLVMSTLLKTHAPFESFLTMGGAVLIAIGLFTVSGMVLIRALGLKQAGWLPSLMFPSTGNLGLPLALYAFGPEGMSYAIVFFTICALGNYTVGNAVAAGAANWRAVARLPLLYATIIGLIGNALQVEPPLWLANTLSLIGGLTTPLMLLMLGGALARMEVRRFGLMAGLSLFRMASGLVVGFGLAWVFGFEGLARSAFIMQAAMPAAVYSYLLAQLWGNEPEQVAALVMVSTLMSLALLPVLLLFLLPA